MGRLVQVLPNPLDAPGGMERIASMIADAARQIGWETMACTDALDKGPPLSRRYPMLNRFATAQRVSAQVRDLLREDDVVVSHSLYGADLRHRRHAYVFHSTFAGQADAMKSWIPGLDYGICRWGYGWLDGRSGHRSRAIAVSARVAEEMQRYYGVQAYRCINNAVDLPSPNVLAAREVRRARYGWQDKMVATVVGRYEGVKGSRLLQRLAPLLDETLVLCLVAPNLQRLPWDSPQSILVPAATRADMWEQVAASDVVLCTSRYEGFGLTLIEAWAAERPVITTPVGIVSELRPLAPGLDQMVVEDPDDAAGFLQRLRRLRDHPELGREQAAWGRHAVAERYSVDVFLGEYRKLLLDLAG